VRVFKIMGQAPHHTFQVLTKRPARMRALLNRWTEQYALRMLEEREIASPWPLPNVWLGTSVEDQRSAAERVPLLMDAPAAVRFLSCEPLLAPINLCQAVGAPLSHEHGPSCREWLTGLGWVIVGGESGPRHRTFDLDWARSLRDQCQTAGIPFFFKQVGGRTPKAGGRLLDGRTWDEMPGDIGARSASAV
jgi:protein gp37